MTTHLSISIYMNLWGKVAKIESAWFYFRQWKIRTKQNPNSLHPHLTSIILTPDSSTSFLLPEHFGKDWEWDLWSHHTFFFFAASSSSHPFPAPEWHPTHGRHFSTHFANINPSHKMLFFMKNTSMDSFQGVESFRNRLFQRGSSLGSQVLYENLLWCEISMGSPCPSGTHICSSVWQSMGCRWVSAPPWTSMGGKWTACLIMGCSMSCREISALTLVASLPKLPWPWCWQNYFSQILSLLSRFLPFLNTVPELLQHFTSAVDRLIFCQKWCCLGARCNLPWHGSNFWCLFTKITLVASALPKTLPWQLYIFSKNSFLHPSKNNIIAPTRSD